MNFELSEDQRLIQDTARRFAASVRKGSTSTHRPEQRVTVGGSFGKISVGQNGEEARTLTAANGVLLAVKEGQLNGPS